MNIIQVAIPQTNYRKGRPVGAVVDKIVMHWIVGTLASADTTFKNPKRLASAHYGVGQTEIHQWVQEADMAYSSGPKANPSSISIEHEGGPSIPLTDAMYENSAQLVADIWKRHGVLPLHRHNEYMNTACPGSLDLGRIERRAKAIYAPTPTPPPVGDKYPMPRMDAVVYLDIQRTCYARGTNRVVGKTPGKTAHYFKGRDSKFPNRGYFYTKSGGGNVSIALYYVNGVRIEGTRW